MAFIRANSLNYLFGVWRSLVAHLHGVQGVAGSNPVTPTNINVSDSISYRPEPETPSPAFYV